jgi:hypothetical protein
MEGEKAGRADFGREFGGGKLAVGGVEGGAVDAFGARAPGAEVHEPWRHGGSDTHTRDWLRKASAAWPVLQCLGGLPRPEFTHRFFAGGKIFLPATLMAWRQEYSFGRKSSQTARPPPPPGSENLPAHKIFLPTTQTISGQEDSLGRKIRLRPNAESRRVGNAEDAKFAERRPEFAPQSSARPQRQNPSSSTHEMDENTSQVLGPLMSPDAASLKLRSTRLR